MMKDIWTVVKFTINDMVKRKSFIISTIIILLMIVLGLNIPNFIQGLSDDDFSNKLLILDESNVFEGSLSTLNNMGYDVEITDLTLLELKEEINNEKLSEALVITQKDTEIAIKYLVKNNDYMLEIPNDLVYNLNTLYTNLQIQKLGLSEEALKLIYPDITFTIESISEENAEGNIVVMMLMSIVLFYAIYFCAYQVSSSITTEKTSKIMETLVTSTSPKTIVLGKTIGIGIVGMLQMILILGTAIITAKLTFSKELLDSIFDMSNITLSLGIITIIYFVLGYLVYSFLYALTGSTISKPEDIQSANSPVVILCMVGFYLSYFTMMNPTSNLNVLASLLPISSPFCMPFRVMLGLASIKDVLISIIILVITILIIAKVAIKIYSNAILNYGTKMSLKDIIAIYKEK